MDEPIPLNCPKCGCRMDPPRDAEPRDDGIVVVECPLHGLFHFGINTDIASVLPTDLPLKGRGL